MKDHSQQTVVHSNYKLSDVHILHTLQLALIVFRRKVELSI
jgi:hypothetical protein